MEEYDPRGKKKAQDLKLITKIEVEWVGWSSKKEYGKIMTYIYPWRFVQKPLHSNFSAHCQLLSLHTRSIKELYSEDTQALE